MTAYPDSSFLFSFYLSDKHSVQALNWMNQVNKLLPVGRLLYFEFCHAVRFAIARKGLSQIDGLRAIADFNDDIANGKVILILCNWENVYQTANRLCTKYTFQKGYRTLDILHVATALTLGVQEFLTFDQAQAQLAQAEGLKML